MLLGSGLVSVEQEVGHQPESPINLTFHLLDQLRDVVRRNSRPEHGFTLNGGRDDGLANGDTEGACVRRIQSVRDLKAMAMG